MFDWSEETPIRDVIGEAVGAASMCWEHPEKAGEFDSVKATEIVDEVMHILQLKLGLYHIGERR